MAERRFERADTAYSPRFREEKPSADDDELRFGDGGVGENRNVPRQARSFGIIRANERM